jgi:D-3-phosphoglycerate dehydrogenase
MQRYRVTITDCDHPSVDIERGELEAIADVDLQQCKTAADVIQTCHESAGLLNQYAPLTREVLKELKACKVIARYGVGVDNIDLEAASDYHIQICNVPDYGVDEVSNHTLALLFALERKVSMAGNRVRSWQWDVKPVQPITRLRGKVAGIFGLGRIGSAFAEKAVALGLTVIAYDPRGRSFERFPFVRRVSFEALLDESDILSIHSPLTDETYHRFGVPEFSRMKPSAYLINTARGSIVDEGALRQALEHGWIAGAGLDVMEQEPPAPDHPLLKLESCVITPHIAWYSEEAFHELKTKAAQEVARVLGGRPPRYPVNQWADATVKE